MEKYIDIMKRTLELTDTCLEALEHIKQTLNEGQLDETFSLMNDSIAAFSQIETSLQSIYSTLYSNRIESLTHSLQSAFDHAVTACEMGQRGKVLEIFQFTLLPNYKKWQTELERVFHHYVVS